MSRWGGAQMRAHGSVAEDKYCTGKIAPGMILVCFYIRCQRKSAPCRAIDSRHVFECTCALAPVHIRFDRIPRYYITSASMQVSRGMCVRLTTVFARTVLMPTVLFGGNRPTPAAVRNITAADLLPAAHCKAHAFVRAHRFSSIPAKSHDHFYFSLASTATLSHHPRLRAQALA